MAAFRPGLSPPAVRIPMRLIFVAMRNKYGRPVAYLSS
jgi:hypothetical protein